MNMRDIINVVENSNLHRIDETNDSYLYHGTALENALGILRDNRIDSYTERDHLPPAVSTSRDPRLAYDVGTWFDRMYPTIFVLDRRSLETRFKIIPHADTDSIGDIWGSGVGLTRGGESEERVMGKIEPLDRYLVSINIKPSDLAEAQGDDDFLRWIVEEDHLFSSLSSARSALNTLTNNPKLNKIKIAGLRL